MMFIFLFVICMAAQGGREDAASSASASATAELECRTNCAVNVGYVTLRLFQRDVPLQEFVQQLDAGRQLERVCSLGDLKRAFQVQGLACEGFRADRAGSILDYLNAQNLIVLRIESFRPGVGHFLMLKASSDGYIVIDPPNTPVLRSREELLSGFPLNVASGEFLVVSELATAPREGPAIVLERSEIDLGSIAQASQEIAGEIRVRNPGTDMLVIRYVGGSCGCVSRIDGAREIPPGGSGILKVTFDKSRLPSGQLLRPITLLTNDPKHEKLIVNFRFLIQNTPEPTDLVLRPQVYDFGRAASSSIVRKIVTVQLLIPEQVSEQIRNIKPETNCPKLKIIQVRDGKEPAGLQGNPVRSLTYEVTWVQAPADGAFEEKVKFTAHMSNGNDRAVALIMRGDSISVRE